MNQVKTPTKAKINTACYRCNKEGHWARDCSLSPNKHAISHPSLTPSYPAHHCRCGAGLCDIRVSHSQNNPGRLYYSCPAKFEMYCKYFKWCDKLKSEDILTRKPKQYPVCGKCGAGVCVIKVEEHKPNVGRAYFACPIKPGDGMCSYRQWVDIYVGESSMEEDQELLSYDAEMQIKIVEMMFSTEPSLKKVEVQIVNTLDGSFDVERGILSKSPEVHHHSVREGFSSHGINTIGKCNKLLKMGEYELEKEKHSTFVSPVENQSSGAALKNHASSSSLPFGAVSCSKLTTSARGICPPIIGCSFQTSTDSSS